MSTKIKICGLTRPEDAESAVKLGVDLLGFVFAKSSRRVTPEQVVKISRNLAEKVLRVGVFVNAPLNEIRDIAAFCRLDLLQLHGSEDEDYCAALSDFNLLKVFRLGRPHTVVKPSTGNFWAVLLDTWLPDQAGGGGRAFDWRLAEAFAGAKFFLAGGLDANNVQAAIRQTRPFGVDVSSGVEASPGIKDWVKMENFIKAVREAENRISS